MNTKVVAFSAFVSAFVCAAFAESEANKPLGFRYRNLTIKPYIAVSYTYDSNVDTAKHASGDGFFMINPGVDFVWKGERWNLTGTLWYRYNAYCKYSDTLGENSYGESLKYEWTTSKPGEKGWSLVLAERYAYISQNDDINVTDGRGIWRDRQRFDITGALERRFTERWHADLTAQYDWLDYKNDTGRYAPLYGWSEVAVGLEAGFAASKWTDILLAGGYTGYRQKSGHNGYKNYSNDSQVYSIMVGLGTHATEKIQYRGLIGWSWLDYGGRSGTDSGWTYQLAANWRMTRQIQWSLLGSSYYQPNERTAGSAIKVYSISGGISYLTLGDRLNLNANLAFRYEENVYGDRYMAAGNDFDETIIAARLGASYTINRWVSVFAQLVWEEEWCEKHDEYDYDRFRGTIGLRFHY